jgi:diadenylate cyclase
MNKLLSELQAYFTRLADTFGYSDIIEFILIALVVYVAYRFLRGTRGARVFRGFLVIFVIAFICVQILAGFLNLERVQLIYREISTLAIIGAIIIFQPELRRGLIQVGQNQFFRPFLKKQGMAFVDILSEAVTRMSREKIGAIIAIERDTAVLGLVETGTLLNAELSADLLMTIFWPGSALHDMGVVVRQDRILAAGCEFPLTQNPPLGPKYGTRHRAALGLSDESDALVIVVSEETGEVSIAESGRLLELSSSGEFRKQLVRALVREQSGSSVASWFGLGHGPKRDGDLGDSGG